MVAGAEKPVRPHGRERMVENMAEAVRARRKNGPGQEERRALMESMAQTRVQINQAYAQFNLQSDPDLVDSCVYEINALQSRYSYFVRRFKELERQEREEAGSWSAG